MANYRLSENTFKQDEKYYTSYGIEYYEDGILQCIPDISADRAVIEEFIDRLNRGRASCIHIHELVEDFIAEI